MEMTRALFTDFFRSRLRDLVRCESSSFGVFVTQSVVDSLREEPQLLLALGEIDFACCLGKESTPSQQAVVIKTLEACLRLRGGLKQCAAAIFQALDLRASAEYHRAWPTLLALERVDSAAGLLRTPGRGRHRERHQARGASAGDGEGDGNDDMNGEQNLEVANLRSLPSAGPQILALLLRFPAEAVQPINSGLPKLLENRIALSALARDNRSAKVLEAALSPSSALLPKLRGKLTRTFKGLLGALGPHPVGGWVCAALWRASIGDHALRDAFAKELLAVEEALRTQNFAVWKVCGLHQAKTRQEEWGQQQQKAGKAHRLFGELLNSGDTAEVAKAAAQTRVRAAEDAATQHALANPLVAELMPDGDTAASEDDAGDDMDAADAGNDDAAAGADAEMENLFSAKPWEKRRLKKRRGAAEGASASMLASDRGSAAKNGDVNLQEALELIAGRAPKRIRKKQKRQRVTGNSAADSGEEDQI